MNIPKETMDILMRTIAQRLTPQPIKLRADIELTCFKPAGIDAIKRALKAGEAVSTPTVPIKARLIAPPFYVLDTNATDKVRARLMNDSCVTSGPFYSGGRSSCLIHAPPLPCSYRLYQHAGVANLEAAIGAIKTSVLSEGGDLNVKMRVR